MKPEKLPPWPWPYSRDQVKCLQLTRAWMRGSRRYKRHCNLLKSWYREIEVLCEPGDQARIFGNMLADLRISYLLGTAIRDGKPVTGKVAFLFPIYYPLSEAAFNRIQRSLQSLLLPLEELRLPEGWARLGAP